MANRARAFVLEPVDRLELERIQRSPSVSSGLARRARAVLLMAENLSGVEVARRTGYTPVQISRVRRRFAEEGVAGLHEKPRSGRPASVTARKTAQVVALTLGSPAAGLTHWTARDMARRAGLSHSTIHRIWKAHDLKPHRLETFKFSKDPQLEEKVRDVVGLYLDPPTNAAVISLDEKTQIQALSRTQPLLPIRPGLPARRTHDYKRNGLTDLYAALEVATGKVIGECSPSHTGADFLRFLKLVARRFPHQQLHVVLDNSSTHSTPQIQSWLAAHPRIHFHFTPKGASWLNLIEAWFSILTRKSVRRGSFDSLTKLIRHIHAYIDLWNKNPKPFLWTKSPAQVIKKARTR
jgi:transposase/transcriptional regulator with XRE-family HTH domain